MRIKQPIFAGLAICIITLASCQNRSNPNLNLNNLESLVLTDSLIQLNTIEDFNFTVDSTKVHFKLKESRSIVAGEQPKIIDISRDPPTVRNVKLSELGQSVQYIKFTPKDSNYFVMTPSKFQFYKNHIIAHNLTGTAVFDQQGNFIDYIAKNDINIFTYGKDSYGISTRDFMGIYRPPVIHNNHLYYLYADNENNQCALSKYDLNKLDYLQPSTSSEIRSLVKGEPLMALKGGFMGGINELQIIDDETWIGFSSAWTSFTDGQLFHSISMQGDTFATFTNHDKVLNYHGGSYRMPERMSNYRLGNKIMYRQPFNDTIYRLVSSNQMVPEYIVFRDKKGVNTRNGINPRFDLTGKVIIEQILETNKWLLIVLKNNHSSPNNKRDGIVQFTYWFYNKATGELIKRPGEFANEDEGIPNDINNGPDIWPSQVTAQGWILYGQAVKWLKEDHTEEELKAMFPFDEFKDNEYILMIVK